MVIAPKLDRLFRSALDALTVVEDMRKRGVPLSLLDLGGDNGATRQSWAGLRIGTRSSTLPPPTPWAGHDKEAKKAVAQLQKVHPGFTVQTWAGIHWTDDPTFNAQYARITEGLRKAVLPEE